MSDLNRNHETVLKPSSNTKVKFDLSYTQYDTSTISVSTTTDYSPGSCANLSSAFFGPDPQASVKDFYLKVKDIADFWAAAATDLRAVIVTDYPDLDDEV